MIRFENFYNSYDKRRSSGKRRPAFSLFCTFIYGMNGMLIKVHQCFVQRFAPGWMSHNHALAVVDRQMLADGLSHCADPIAGMRSGNHSANQLTGGRVGDQLDKTARRLLDHGFGIA